MIMIKQAMPSIFPNHQNSKGGYQCLIVFKRETVGYWEAGVILPPKAALHAGYINRQKQRCEQESRQDGQV